MILMNDFQREPESIRRAMMAATEKVFLSGWYVLGHAVKTFESEWAGACDVAHGVGVGNGMDAIEIALRALGIGPGDEVITTPMTAFATVLGICRAGATPVLADIEPQTGLMSLDSARRCVSGQTKAVLLVHLYGQMRAMASWHSFCAERGLQLIEDCAQSHLAVWGGRPAGNWGRAGAYSFYPTKNLGAIGDGGMLVTADASLESKARQLRNYGQSERYHHPVMGMNSRLDELQAAILSARLPFLSEFTERRRSIARAYHAGIRNPEVTLLLEPQEPTAHVYHLFVLTCARRDRLQAHLAQHQVQSLIHYPIPIHFQEPCRSIQRDPDGLASSEWFAQRCLSLPCHPQMTDSEVQQVIDAVNLFGRT